MFSPLPEHTLNYRKKNNMGKYQYYNNDEDKRNHIIGVCILIFIAIVLFIAGSIDKKNEPKYKTTIKITYQDNTTETLIYNSRLMWTELEEGDLSIDNTVIRSSVKSFTESEKEIPKEK